MHTFNAFNSYIFFLCKTLLFIKQRKNIFIKIYILNFIYYKYTYKHIFLQQKVKYLIVSVLHGNLA